MNKYKMAILILVYFAVGIAGFNYMIIEQENILRRYFILEPQERVKEFNNSLSGSLSKYFLRENRSSSIRDVENYIKRYGNTSLFELAFIFKDEEGALKEVSKNGITSARDKILSSKWVYPAAVNSGNIDGYLVVIIKEAGQAEVREGLKKYITISYSLRFLFILLLLALLGVLLYHNYSAKMKLARDIAEVKASNDGMTGLHTHEHFMRALEVEVGKFRIYNIPVALLMLDIDYFKKFNDTFGHQAGDEVLKEVAAIIRANTRATDILARYGGEEFAVIIPYVAKQEGKMTPRERLKAFTYEIENVAERIRKNVEDKKIQFLANEFKVTISIGASYYYKKTEHAGSAKLLERADKALYKAKRLGRNRIWVDYEAQAIST